MRSPVIALGDIYAQVPHLDEVTALMRRTQESMRKLPGCISYAFAETLEEPGHFLVVQQWRDEAALEGHFRSTEFAAYQAGIRGLLVRSSELRVHSAKELYRPFTSAGDDPQFDE
jgi:quinol monooxygenase YgiN